MATSLIPSCNRPAGVANALAAPRPGHLPQAAPRARRSPTQRERRALPPVHAVPRRPSASSPGGGDASDDDGDDDSAPYPFEEAEFTRIVPAIIGTVAGGSEDGVTTTSGGGRGTIVFAAPPQTTPGWASADARRVRPAANPPRRGAAGGGRGRVAAAAASAGAEAGGDDETGADGPLVLTLDASTPVLAMEIGGDALLALLLDNGNDGDEGDARRSKGARGGGRVRGRRARAPSPPARRLPPLALDVLWAVLARAGAGAPGGLADEARPARGSAASTSAPPPARPAKKQAWGLVRAAFVSHDKRTGAFVGRLFFGDPASGEVAWECEARPADAAWLAQRAGAPLLVRRDVFASRAVPLGSLLADDDDDDGDSGDDDGEGAGSECEGATEPRRTGGRRRRGRARGAATKAAAAAARPPHPSQLGASSFPSDPASPSFIRPGDPPSLILLKRQLAVAVAEEDYQKAAALRDRVAAVVAARARAAARAQAAREKEKEGGVAESAAEPPQEPPSPPARRSGRKE